MLLSESLGVSTSQLWKHGVFDSYLGIDSLLHVDPARLRSARIPELLGSYKRFHGYFSSLLDLIAAAKPGDALERQAIKKLIFPEIREAALGYAEASNVGRGVTEHIAKKLYTTAKTIIDAGIKNPSIFEVAVLFEDEFGAEPYDFESDPRGVIIWHETSREVAKKNPLHLPAVKTTDDVYAVVYKICEHFKHLVEEKRLNELLFDGDGRPKIEKASQLLFFGIADAYCFSNNIDISREPETGRGPADFKLSRGYHERVIVEAKLSSNGKYLDGLTAQLPTYLKAEKAKHGIHLLIQIGDHEKKLQRIRRLHSKLKKSGHRIPDLFIVDALDKLSASKLNADFDWSAILNEGSLDLKI
jgi:hypothetical protein